MSQSPNLLLDLITAGLVDGYITHNEGMQALDALVMPMVLDRDLNEAPAASNGDRYIVAEGVPSGDDWFGKAGQIAYRVDGEWRFAVPKAGWRVWVEDEQLFVQWIVGSGWRSVLGDAVLALRRTTSAQTITTWAGIQWNAETVKDGAVYAHDNVTNPDQITLVEAGRYLVQADVTFEVTTSAGYDTAETRFTLQGGAVAGSLAVARLEIAAVTRVTLSSQMVITAAAGNILLVEAQRAAGTSTLRVVQDYTRCTIRKLNHA